MTDPYAVTADYYHLMSEPYWRQLRPVLTDALREVDPAAGPVLDIGAGTGLSTAVVADALPAARILALEPSAAMCAALHTRTQRDPALRARVTIHAATLADAEPLLPPALSAVVATAVLHHFDADERRLLTRVLAERLAPGAPAFVEVQEPPEPCHVPPTRYHSGTVGDLAYEGWMRAEPGGAGTMDWTMTYRTTRAGHVLDERSACFRMHPIPLARIESEAAEAGLVTRRLGCGLLELRSAGGGPR
ncbi:class I SAM-dependent methyltransferase [Embleya sp. NPDC059259]|uniref:class I SAM-dependent methyltransferase n=1 Tax=unclassified Embleya TaxID=2699296 RepID=UPI0036CA6504